MNGVQEAFSRRGDSLQEGDLVTGTIDIANERAYMVAPNNRAGRDEALVRVCLFLTDRLTYYDPVSTR